MTTTQTTLNGINVDALNQTIQAISADATRGTAGFHVDTRWTGGTRTSTNVDHWVLGGQRLSRNFTISTDEPPELCGGNSAPNPQEVLMAGLNACMMVGYAAVCALKNIELESLEIETWGELDLRGFLGLESTVNPGYNDIEYTVRIKGIATPEEFEEVHRIVMATSPNFANISRPIKLKPTLIVD